MSNSFAEQLSNVKLKPSKDKTKDFSDPKLAGFITKDQISTYQKNALEANMEEWQIVIRDISYVKKEINSTTGIKTLKGSALHQQNILVRTLEPARHSLKLANTHSPKSISLHDNEQALTGKSTIATPSTIHESDEGIVENNSDDDEDAARSSNTIDD
ncbi:unnamed protein product [Rotaria socialis]|uniref:Uncharacterized protein n=1 Tax=Rotaria socialis TaxID=392032 RepID=A0A818ZSB6_9BILA|nr:unnamed protein product [Rotaria socialis]